MESSIVESCIRWLNSLPECRARKVGGDEKRAGEPDVDAVLRGRAIKVEAKRPAPYGKPPTPLQVEIMKKWAAAGAVTGVFTSKAELQELLKKAGLLDELSRQDRVLSKRG